MIIINISLCTVIQMQVIVNVILMTQILFSIVGHRVTFCCGIHTHTQIHTKMRIYRVHNLLLFLLCEQKKIYKKNNKLLLQIIIKIM